MSMKFTLSKDSLMQNILEEDREVIGMEIIIHLMVNNQKTQMNLILVWFQNMDLLAE